LDRWKIYPRADEIWTKVKATSPNFTSQEFIRKIVTARHFARATAASYVAYERDRAWITKWIKVEVSKLLSSKLPYSEIADGLKQIASHLRSLELRYTLPEGVGHISRQAGSRAPRLFAQNMDRYLRRHCGKPLHNVLAMLLDVTFPRRKGWWDRDDVVALLKPTTKETRTKKSQAAKR
jgi:hypothetical protein